MAKEKVLLRGESVSEKDRLKSLLKEAEVYRLQGLLEQSMTKYLEALQFVEKHDRFSKDKRLLRGLKLKIEVVEELLKDVDEAPETPEVSSEVQDLISKLFSFSKNKDIGVIEAAVALAKFGQYERAVAEFERLIQEGTLPLVAAKNMLQCHLSLATPEAAIKQFKRWVSRHSLTQSELRNLRTFLGDLLERNGIRADLPPLDAALHEEDEAEEEELELLDISTISIPLPEGPLKGQRADFEVSFQSGSTVSIVIPRTRKDLADAFETGLRVPEIQCYSSIGFFNGSGVVSSKKRVPSGPKARDYTLDITIKDM